MRELRRRRYISKPRASAAPPRVTRDREDTLPRRGCINCAALIDATPSGYEGLSECEPRAALRLPWALISNAFGVKTRLLCAGVGVLLALSAVLTTIGV